MKKNLVIILAQTRAYERTFQNIKENLIEATDSDVCLCIGVHKKEDENDPFFKIAKYKFLYPEPDDYAEAYQKFFPQKNWRKFLKIKDQFMGGIKDDLDEHFGSGGILLFFRHFLMLNLLENNLLEKYERFVITRSDFIFTKKHIKLEQLDPQFTWIPDGEHYGGYTDRHAVLSKRNIISYLNILEKMFENDKYYNEMLPLRKDWNLEKLIKFHLEKESQIVKHIPYIMYSIRLKNGKTRWCGGNWCQEKGYFIKYGSEYKLANL